MTKIHWKFDIKKFKSFRRMRGLTHEDIGAICGRTGRSVINWESRVTSPTVEDVLRIANGLGLDLREFFIKQTSTTKSSKSKTLEPVS